MSLARPLLSLMLLVSLAASAVAQEFSAKEVKARAKSAEVVASWARACADSGAEDLGRRALGEAKELGLAEEDVTAIAEALDSAGDLDDDALAQARKAHAKKLVKAYDTAADAGGTPEASARWRLRALEWDASKGRGRKLAQWIGGLDDLGTRARLLGGALAAVGPSDAGAAIRDTIAGDAEGGLFLIGSGKHQLVAFLSLPKGWKSSGSYPVLIGVDGAGSGFEGYGRASTGARGSRQVIGLYPMTLSNTNALNPAKYPHYAQTTLDTEGDGVMKRLAFDLAGVNAILEILRAHFGAEDRVFLTGFSGGGQFTYYKLLQEPEQVAGAVPCCGNFSGAGGQGAPKAGADGGPQVLILTGDKDPHREFTFGKKDSPGIEPQTDLAMKVLGELGYANVERRMVPAGHSPLHQLAWEFVERVLAAR